MSKKIIETDVKQIKDLMCNIWGTGEYTEIVRLGGLTNHTYRVKIKDEEYAVRIPGEGTENIIVRKDEKISTELACNLGIDEKLIYFDENGVKITKYIDNAETMNADLLKKEENIRHVANIFKTLHNCGKDTKVPFEVFDMASEYEKVICDMNVRMFEDYDSIKNEVMSIKVATDDTFEIKKVPCHNDPLCENWIRSADRMYLIDWEYAGMNDGMWDLADVSIEAGFDHKCDYIMLKEYLGKEPDIADKKHLLANKIYVDYLWTLWAKARVPYDGQPMEDWAVERYTRLKSFIEDYKNIK